MIFFASQGSRSPRAQKLEHAKAIWDIRFSNLQFPSPFASPPTPNKVFRKFLLIYFLGSQLQLQWMRLKWFKDWLFFFGENDCDSSSFFFDPVPATPRQSTQIVRVFFHLIFRLISPNFSHLSALIYASLLPFGIKLLWTNLWRWSCRKHTKSEEIFFPLKLKMFSGRWICC